MKEVGGRGSRPSLFTGPPNRGTATLHQVNHVLRIQMPARPRAALPSTSVPIPSSSSLACSAWPSCFGLRYPPHRHHTLFSGRLNLGTVGVSPVYVWARPCCVKCLYCQPHVHMGSCKNPPLIYSPLPPVHIPRGVESDISDIIDTPGI